VETGGTQILSYNVQWDLGSDGAHFSTLVGYSTTYSFNTYSTSANLQAGKTYQIKVRAKNYWDWGPFSEVLTIKASDVPEKMDPVMTSIDPATGGVRV